MREKLKYKQVCRELAACDLPREISKTCAPAPKHHHHYSPIKYSAFWTIHAQNYSTCMPAIVKNQMQPTAEKIMTQFARAKASSWEAMLGSWI